MKRMALLGWVVASAICLAAAAIPVPAQETEATPLHVPGRFMAGQSVSRVPPVYPPAALQAKIEGAVKLKAVIGADGVVRDVTVQSGAEALRQAAIDAVSKWRYKPYLLKGKPVPVETRLLVNFRLEAAVDADGKPETEGYAAWPARKTKAATQVSGGVMSAQLLKHAIPVYPAEARVLGVEGFVVLDAVVSPGGTIETLEVVSGPKELEASALEAVRQWTYRPYLLNGKPVEVETTVTVRYRLADADRTVAADLPKQ